MIQTLSKTLTFAEFAEWIPENKRYELHDGVIVKVAQPIGEHENVTGFLIRKLSVEFERLNLPYFIAPKVLVKPEGKESGFSPDVLVLNKGNLSNEALYKKASTVSQSTTIPLVIEVVSTNWSDDYALKFDEYSDVGIGEYWIVDYLGKGGKEFIGNPKQPTFTICKLVNGEYKRTLLRVGDRIESNILPELNLTVEQVFQAATF